jgi:hypothetical protein
MSAAEPASYRVDGETLRKDAPVLVFIALDLAFLPASAGLPALIAGIVVLVLVPVVYSAVLFKRLAP